MSSVAWVRKKTRQDPGELALRMAATGAPEGTVIQGGTSSEGTLRFSAILRPKPCPEVGLLALLATFCESEGIRKDTGIITWIRWPSEVVTENRVVATTSFATGGPAGVRWAILNFLVNRRRHGRDGSTSLEDQLGVLVDPEMLVTKTIDSLTWMYSGWVKGMYPQVLARITSMLESPGKRVFVKRRGRPVPGVARGVDERGRLIVELSGTEASARVEDRSCLLSSEDIVYQ